MPSVAIRTMVVDDSPEMLRALCTHLITVPAVELIGTANSGGEAVARAATLRPALVLLDFQLGGMNGLDAAKKIKSSLPSTKTVIVTIHDGAGLRATVLANGVDGFLSKSRFRQDFTEELARLFPETPTIDEETETTDTARCDGD